MPVPLHEPNLINRPQSEVITRLDALLLVLKSCKGITCIDPWKVLHPAGDVGSLSMALGAQFDGFYKAQPKVSFTRCEMGYLVESEGPQVASVYGQGAFETEGMTVDSQHILKIHEEDQRFYKGRLSDWT
jgi:N-acetylglucosamine-6-sulfatase